MGANFAALLYLVDLLCIPVGSLNMNANATSTVPSATPSPSIFTGGASSGGVSVGGGVYVGVLGTLGFGLAWL